MDAQHAPWQENLRYISAEVLCTSRDLPLMLQQELGQFIMADSMPVKALTLRRPTPPRPALAERVQYWRLISQLQMNYLSLMDSENEEGAAALRQLLGLYANLAETPVARQVDGVRHCVLEPVHRRVPEPGPVVFARGIGITLTVDERAFSGASPWLFGSVLERLLPARSPSTALRSSRSRASSAAKLATGRRAWVKGAGMSEVAPATLRVHRLTPLPDAFWRGVRETPWRYDLFQLLRRIDAGRRTLPAGARAAA